MFNSSLGGGGGGGGGEFKYIFFKSSFCISLPVLVIVFSCLVICMCFSFFILFVLCLISGSLMPCWLIEGHFEHKHLKKG